MKRIFWGLVGLGMGAAIGVAAGRTVTVGLAGEKFEGFNLQPKGGQQ